MPTRAVELRGLRKAYRDVVAVDGLELTVEPGECFGLLGPNGAGKTTTIEMCEGLTVPDQGEVRILGETWARNGKSLRQRLGISLQETQFSDKLTVGETLQLFRSFYPRPRPLEEILAAVELGEKRNGRVGQLSGGQKQRLALACALVADPELFFLDEPTTGLDPQSRRQLWNLIEGMKQAGRTVVITTHYMEEAEVCNRIAIIDKGKIIAMGSPEELKRMVSGDVVYIRTADNVHAKQEIETLLNTPVSEKEGELYMTCDMGDTCIPEMIRKIGEKVLSVRLQRPTLNDVFLKLTGKAIREGDASPEEGVKEYVRAYRRRHEK